MRFLRDNYDIGPAGLGLIAKECNSGKGQSYTAVRGLMDLVEVAKAHDAESGRIVSRIDGGRKAGVVVPARTGKQAAVTKRRVARHMGKPVFREDLERYGGNRRDSPDGCV